MEVEVKYEFIHEGEMFRLLNKSLNAWIYFCF